MITPQPPQPQSVPSVTPSLVQNIIEMNAQQPKETRKRIKKYKADTTDTTDYTDYDIRVLFDQEKQPQTDMQEASLEKLCEEYGITIEDIMDTSSVQQQVHTAPQPISSQQRHAQQQQHPWSTEQTFYHTFTMSMPETPQKEEPMLSSTPPTQQTATFKVPTPEATRQLTKLTPEKHMPFVSGGMNRDKYENIYIHDLLHKLSPTSR
jgi:hypothetical protein